MPFIDTNIFVAALNKKDKHHKEGHDLLTKAFQATQYLQVSDYILNESLTVAWARTHSSKLVQQLDNLMQTSEKIEILKVDETTFATAKTYMRKHPNIIPTLTDWTTIILMRDHRIPQILSFDTDFDTVKNIPDFKKIKRIYTTNQLQMHQSQYVWHLLHRHSEDKNPQDCLEADQKAKLFCAVYCCAVERKSQTCLLCEEFPCDTHYQKGLIYKHSFLDAIKRQDFSIARKAIGKPN